MKFTWMKWSALHVAVLVAGSVAMAQDQSSAGSQQPAPAPAATPAPAPAAKPKPTVAQRKENQQDRIAQAVRSDQLSPGETARLERNEAGIDREERHMRAADDGHLTQQDRRIITRQQNRESHRIYRNKHNGHTG